MTSPVRIAADVDRRTFEQLAKRARDEHRSIAAEIRVAVESHLAKPPAGGRG